MAHAPRTVPLTQPLTYLWRPVQGEETAPRVIEGRRGRGAKKWFSFDMPVDAARPMALIITYPASGPLGWRTRRRRRSWSGCRGEQKVTVRFQAMRGNETATVFG